MLILIPLIIILNFNKTDSTADYISGGECIDETTGLHLNGLRCVTVLIGAYFQSSGLPVLGVINQPFYTQTDDNVSVKIMF